MPPLLDTKKGQSGRIDRKVTNQVVVPQDDRAITSQALAPAPTIKLTQPEPSTKAASELGYFESLITNTQAQAQQRQSQADESRNMYLEAALKSETEGSLTDSLYKQSVDPLEAELNDINSQLAAEQHALRRRIEAIRRNEQGAYGGAVEDMVQEAERESLSKQADLAIVQMSKQGRYDSAKAIADRAIKAIFEKQERQLDALKFNYEENKDLFTTSEERAFELMQGDREMKLQEEKEMRMAEFQQSIRVNDPLYKAQLSKAQADAVAAHRDLTSGVLTDAQIKNIDTSPQGKKVTTLGDLKQKLSNYQTLIDTYGTASFGTQKAELESAYNELKIAYKTAADLGAIQAPDIPVIEGALKNATFANPASQLWAKMTGGGVGSIKAGLNQAMQTLNNSAAVNITQLYARNPSYRNSEYVGSLVDPLSSAVTSEDMFDTAVVGQILKLPDNTYVQKQKDGTFKEL